MPTNEPIIPIIGYPSPGVPPFDISNTGNDARQLIIERMRRAVRGTKVAPLKTEEQLRREQEQMILSQGKADPFSELALVTTGENVEKRPSTRAIDIFILNMETLERIQFYYVPREVDYDPNAEFVALNTMARNIPVYHYTGGADVLTLEIDWFAKEEDRKDVIRNCKIIEAMSKNDGYDKPPPRVKLLWGEFMFSESTWLVKSAGYRLSLPHGDKGMAFQQAYQKLVLIKVAEENPSRETILNINT